MANRVQIRRGPRQPSSTDLLSYELGWDSSANGKVLYINDNGTIRPVIDVSSYVTASVDTSTETLILTIPAS